MLELPEAARKRETRRLMTQNLPVLLKRFRGLDVSFFAP
jgi:hypothetical protein